MLYYINGGLPFYVFKNKIAIWNIIFEGGVAAAATAAPLTTSSNKFDFNGN